MRRKVINAMQTVESAAREAYYRTGSMPMVVEITFTKDGKEGNATAPLFGEAVENRREVLRMLGEKIRDEGLSVQYFLIMSEAWVAKRKADDPNALGLAPSEDPNRKEVWQVVGSDAFGECFMRAFELSGKEGDKSRDMSMIPLVDSTSEKESGIKSDLVQNFLRGYVGM